MLQKQEERVAILVSNALKALKKEQVNKRPMEGKADGKSSSRKTSK